MAIPVANFSDVVSGLEITFTDTSTNTPLFWAWYFGDGTTSVAQNPIKQYNNPGTYAITLAAGNNDGVSLYTKVITVVAVVPGTLSIATLVSYQIPSDLLATINTQFPTEIGDFTKIWEAYLAPISMPKILDADKYIESSWSDLQRALIASLVAFEVFNAQAMWVLFPTSDAARSASLQQITTGPAESKWFSSATFWQAAVRPNGLIESVKQTSCTLASMLRVYLPWCPPFKPQPNLFKVASKFVPKNPYIEFVKRYMQ